MNPHRIVLSKLLQSTSLASIHYSTVAASGTITNFSGQQRWCLSKKRDSSSLFLSNSDPMTSELSEWHISKRFCSNSKFPCRKKKADKKSLGPVPPLCEKKAYELVMSLKDAERVSLKTALEKYASVQLREGLEGELAATRWRTKFGRLSKVPAALGDVDPTGSFCTFPEDWLQKKAAEKVLPPSTADIYKIFMVNAIPFIVFGFLDNFFMITAGDSIEQLFDTFMCISTMAAAGLGNTISDVLGIGSAFYVEQFCAYLGLRPPDLLPAQMEMKQSRNAANAGRIIGITIGCLIGMFPLMFIKKKPNKEEEAQPSTESKK